MPSHEDMVFELQEQLKTHDKVRIIDEDGNLMIIQDVGYDGELDEIVVEVESYDV